jgi:hypothetical protein
MRDVQRIGVVGAGIALLLWVALVVALNSTGPEDGVNLAPFTIGLPAVAVAVTAAVVLLVSVPDLLVRGAAAVSLAGWCTLLADVALSAAPFGSRTIVVLIAAQVALCLAAGRILATSGRRPSPD